MAPDHTIFPLSLLPSLCPLLLSSLLLSFSLSITPLLCLSTTPLLSIGHILFSSLLFLSLYHSSPLLFSLSLFFHHSLHFLWKCFFFPPVFSLLLSALCTRLSDHNLSLYNCSDPSHH